MKGKNAVLSEQEIDLDLVDIDRECPHFKHALARQDAHFLPDEVDHIRVDLEILLSSSIARLAALQDDLEICEGGGALTSKMVKCAKTTPVKSKSYRAELTELSPFKKRSKSAVTKQQPLSVSVISKSRGGKAADFSAVATSQPGPTTPGLDNARLLHSKAVDQFWSSLEPYCADISQSTIKSIEDFMSHYAKNATDNKNNNLGSHSKPESLKSGTTSTLANPKQKGKSSTNLGPLTRRLVAALLEDNYASDSQMSSSNDQFSTSTTDGVCGPPPSSMALARALDLGNTVSLERRVRKILENNDIFDSSESESDSGNHERPESPASPSKRNAKDEVSAELARCQEELSTASESNRAMLTAVIATAKSASTVGSLKSQLSNLETEIEESYQRVQSSKIRKKTPNIIKREREQFQRLLEEWRKVASQLEHLF